MNYAETIPEIYNNTKKKQEMLIYIWRSKRNITFFVKSVKCRSTHNKG